MIQVFRFCISILLATRCSFAWVSQTTPRQPIHRTIHSRSSPRHFTRLHAASTTADTETSSSPTPKQLYLYNSKTRQKEPLQIQDPDKVTMYTCGPTVYDYAHVGNFRAFLTYDLLKRALLYLGYKTIQHVLNLTDVDDKIIHRANELKLETTQELTLKYEQFFLQDLSRLNILPATVYPRATEHVEQMIDLIVSLRDKDLAYETSDGSWYFHTQNMPEYGTQLVQLDFDNDNDSTEVATATEDASDSTIAASEKKHEADFCLWKAFKQGVDRLDVAWHRDGVLQLGRPGWHLECSAMALYYFDGATIDLHGGGQDLKFPHHENEIAQAQGATGNVFCNCWFHNGFVNMDAEKMSKSLGNFLTLPTACPTALDVRAYRYLVVSSQYRNPLAFTPQAMEASKNAIKRMDKIRVRIQQEAVVESVNSDEQDGVVSSDDSHLATEVVPRALQNFEAAVVDDLSMPRAAAQLFTLIKEAENEFKRVAKQGESDDQQQQPLDIAGLRAVLDAMMEMDRVLGVFYDVPSMDGSDSSTSSDSEDAAIVPLEVLDLVSQRTTAKDAQDWALADSLRKRVQELGFVIKDNKGAEPTISRAE